MKILRRILTIILVIYSVPTFLAGMDIYLGDEPDLSTEWIVVTIYFLLSLLLLILLSVRFIKRIW